MELGTTVTYCSLEGVSLCGNTAIQSARASYFGGRSWIWCEHRHTFPQHVQSTITFIVIGLETEGILVSVVD